MRLLRSVAARASRADSARGLARVAREPEFVHLAPSGDHWVGSAMYAAKHNPSDYVRSLALPLNTVLADDVPADALLAMYDAKALDPAYLAPAWDPGPPAAAVAPAGVCQLAEAFVDCEVLARHWIGDDAFVVRFGLPDARSPLNLSTCACVLAGYDDAVRPYTPVSTNALVGAFDLLVRVYEGGVLSTRLATVDVGDDVAFKHIPFNVKVQYPFARRVGMIAGGTGVTPMIQALHAILGTADDTTEVSMLYGSKSSENILAGAELDAWAAAHPRLSLTHVMSEEPASSAWAGARGLVDAALLKQTMPPPSDECQIFVCGPEGMYEALCGPRGDPELAGALRDLGYSKDQVVKF